MHKRHPVEVGERGDVGIGEHIVARQSPNAAMPIVEHCEAALVEGAKQIVVGTGNLGATRSVHLLIGTAIQLLLRQVGTDRIEHGAINLGIVHIALLFIVGEKQEVGLPLAIGGINVVVMADFFQYVLCFLNRRDRKSTHANVDTAFAVDAFAVVHQGKIVVGAEA